MKTILNDISKFYKKLDCVSQLLLIIIVILLIVHVYRIMTPIKETFIEEGERFIVHKGPDIYDEFYTNIYDDLLYSKVKNNFEIGQIINSTEPTEQSYILDIGSGPGHHVAQLNKQKIPTIGMDSSPAMVALANKKYPDLDFIKGDGMSSMAFPSDTFTHILCLYFTIYYIKDKRQFLQNCYNWLMPGGFMVLHLVDRDMFDPILPSGNPLYLISPQNHAKKRITTTNLVFDKFKYKADFKQGKNSDISTFLETFDNKDTGKIRQNEHTLYMPTQKSVLAIAKDIGFILQGKIDMVSIEYEYQYLYILQKPE